MSDKVRHPAQYDEALYRDLSEWLVGYESVLDPFGGKAAFWNRFYLQDNWVAMDIEPEWASCSGLQGNALQMPFADNTFGAICTSPVYGNRMSDSHDALDDATRLTYKHTIGHDLHKDNAGAMQWGAAYRQMHRAAWTEARRVLRPGGLLLIVVSDHIRNKQQVPVVAWHHRELCYLGFRDSFWHVHRPRRATFGRNHNARVAVEHVIGMEILK